MVRRGPASVFARKSRSKQVSEDCPDRFRPSPCMPDDDSAVGLFDAPPSRCPSSPRSPRAHLRVVGLGMRYGTQFTGFRQHSRLSSDTQNPAAGDIENPATLVTLSPHL